jgi:hypothetical protein
MKPREVVDRLRGDDPASVAKEAAELIEDLLAINIEFLGHPSTQQLREDLVVRRDGFGEAFRRYLRK